MSVEEEVELRDLVAQTLELNGCLPKIRAQLRASLFLALDEDSKISKQQPLANTKIKTHLEVPEGQLMFCLVREFLEYFGLDFTISVYEPESYVGNCYKYQGREKIIEDLGLKISEDSLTGPVLLHLVKIAQTKSKTLKINLTNVNEDKDTNGSSSLSSVPVEVNGQSCLSEVEDNLVDSKERHNVTERQQPVLDATFALKNLSPSSKQDAEVRPKLSPLLETTFIKKNVDNDDTFNGTSSIEEEALNNSDSSNQKLRVSEDEHASSTDQDSSPDSKSKSEERTKSSPKEKLKSKLDLSPLHLNKSRGSDILPSLYNKDFKEKNNKEFDFDIKDDYEEDFMSGSEAEFSLGKAEIPKPLLEELQQYSSETPSDSTKGKFFINFNTQQGGKNSNSDNKLINNSTATDDIETTLSVDGGPENSIHTNSQINF